MVGGKGTRLLPLTETKPKIILPVADRPCLWYLLRSLARAGIEEVILACGYKSEQMVEAIGDGSDLGIRVVYSYESEPMGTGGAIRLVADRLDETFVAANGDVFADIDIRAEIEEHIRTGASVTIALTPVENPCEFGIARVQDDGRITEFKEKPKEDEVFSNLINAGVYVIRRSVLDYVPEGRFYDFSKDLVPALMADGHRIQGFTVGGIWMDVGRPHDLLGANLAVAGTEFAGARADLPGTSVEGRFYLGEGSSVESSEVRESVVLRGSSVKGSRLDRVLVMRGCVVEGAVVENSILGDGCVLREGAVVRNAVLADNTVVGPGGSVIEDRKV